VWGLYAVLGAILVAYLLTLLLRNPGAHWTWLDGWVICAVEIVAALMCIARGVSRSAPPAYAILGVALLCWAVGDLALTAESLSGSPPPIPSTDDVFYLLFYPTAYVALVLLLRSNIGRNTKPNWLDGIVAGLGAAAVCSVFLFHSLIHDLGDTASAVATNVSYPIGDMLLLFLVIGGTVLLADRWHPRWIMLGAGITLNIVGDTFNLFQGSDYSSHVGTTFNAIAWPASILLMSMSAWLRPARPDPFRPQRVAGVALPGAAAIGCLVLLVFGAVRSISLVAVGLASATLVAVGIRLALSARELRRLTVAKEREAATDELTGMGNRRRLAHVLDALLADDRSMPESQPRQIAFLFIDLDRFKEINDSLGHSAGDELLRQLGPRINRVVAGRGLAVRIGGDEFGVVLADADTRDALAVAERLLSNLCQPFVLHGVTTSVGASVGIAVAPTDATVAADLVSCADHAMYRAKLGDTRIATFDPGLDGGEQQLDLVRELQDAVDQGAFLLHYQPQVDIRDGHVVGVEALIRWPHPRLGLVQPLRFLPLAEEAGLMQRLTTWVIEHAFAQCARWRAAGCDVTVSVNIAASDLLRPGFADEVLSQLQRHGLSSRDIVLELTETNVITDFPNARLVIQRLHDLGFVVSIDDFGAGFTSLAYLGGLAVGELKLDRSFILTLAGSDSDREIDVMRSTIQLGHDVGLRVVAEGVEDHATLSVLRDLGCDVVQGFLVGMPVPAGDLAAALDQVPLSV
jgi:diguanylate cyclase (GGDEF)-like protein